MTYTYKPQDEIIKTMIGKVFTSVTKSDAELVFKNDNEQYRFYHLQDCCEEVLIDDVTGEIADLANSPITFAEVSTSDEYKGSATQPDIDDSRTWTFYKFATNKGWVDVRWYGTSNGYYSEEVDLVYIDSAGNEICSL